MNLHLGQNSNNTMNEKNYNDIPKGYPIRSGILENEAIHLLKSFYDRENYHAPDDKRKRKPPLKGK